MSFLAQVVSAIVIKLGSKFLDWVIAFEQRMMRRRQIGQESKDSVKDLKDAKTADEIAKATDKTLGGL